MPRSVPGPPAKRARRPERRTADFPFRPIGFVRSPHRERASVPKGLGARHRAEGWLEVQPELAAGLQDIEGFSHLYVLWVFHQSDGFELVGTPPSDGRPHGVFATRSPRRPNPIGLTVVELVEREGRRLRVRGLDMIDGTPILDIKPYLSNVSVALRRGWLAEAEARMAAAQEPSPRRRGRKTRRTRASQPAKRAPR